MMMGLSLSGQTCLPVRSGWGHMNFLNVTFKVVDHPSGFIKWFKRQKLFDMVLWLAERLSYTYRCIWERKKRERIWGHREQTVLPCSCLKRPSRMLEYCTWFTKAAGERHGSCSRGSKSMSLLFHCNTQLLSLWTVRPSNPDSQLLSKTNRSLHKSRARSHEHGM